MPRPETIVITATPDGHPDIDAWRVTVYVGSTITAEFTTGSDDVAAQVDAHTVASLAIAQERAQTGRQARHETALRTHQDQRDASRPGPRGAMPTVLDAAHVPQLSSVPTLPDVDLTGLTHDQVEIVLAALTLFAGSLAHREDHCRAADELTDRLREQAEYQGYDR